MSKPELLGPYTLEQPEGVFPLGGDTLALGAFATVRSHWRVCDLGTGSGALLLLLAGREPTLTLTGVELAPIVAQAAKQPNSQWSEGTDPVLRPAFRSPARRTI